MLPNAIADITFNAIIETRDELYLNAHVAIVLEDGPPRIEISSYRNLADVHRVDAIDRAARVFLIQVANEIRKLATA